MRVPALLGSTALVIGAASTVMQGPLPGDVALTRALQAVLGPQALWADWVTDTAKSPLLWATLAAAMALAWWAAPARAQGWRAALTVPLAYALAFVTDKTLRAVLSVPRPDPALVAVAEPSASSGLPSTFGLVYGAVFGATLLRHGGWLARAVAGALLVIGLCARIVLGGHWPSQILASAAFGLLMAWAAYALVERVAGAQR